MLTVTGDRDFRFPEPGPEMFTLTCVNHPNGKWLTKHPALRSIHWIGWLNEAGDVEYSAASDVTHGLGIRECSCPFGDLRVVENEVTTAVDARRGQ
jgi:hypothetical protein